jgi:hypothetical protein
MEKGGGVWLDKCHSPCAACDTQQPRAIQLWPQSRVLVECLFLLLPPFLFVAWSCAVVDKKEHTIGAVQKLILKPSVPTVGAVFDYPNCAQSKNFPFFIYFYKFIPLLLFLGRSI